MKKVLLAGVAIVALGAGSAQAADPIKLSLGGYMNEFFGYAGNKDGKNYGNAPAQANNLAKVIEENDERIYFKGSTKLDNGIEVGTRVDMNATQGLSTGSIGGPNKGIINAYATVSGVFGTVKAGQMRNVAYNAHNTAPDVAGMGASDGYYSNFLLNPDGRGERTANRDDQSTDKVAYITPQFAGFNLGVSYAPSSAKGTTGTGAPVSSYDGGLHATAQQGDMYAEVVSYAHEFGKVSVKADVGATQENFLSQNDYQGGVNVGFAGFTIGGSYLQRNTTSKSVIDKGTAGTGGTWDLGAQYDFGPYSVSFNHLDVSSANTTGVRKDKESVWDLGGAYNMGPGVAVNLSVFEAKYTDGAHITGNENQGWGVLSGLALSF